MQNKGGRWIAVIRDDSCQFPDAAGGVWDYWETPEKKVEIRAIFHRYICQNLIVVTQIKCTDLVVSSENKKENVFTMIFHWKSIVRIMNFYVRVIKINPS